MDQLDLADRFGGDRWRLRSVTYRIVGSLSEAEPGGDPPVGRSVRAMERGSAEISDLSERAGHSEGT
jgi:hypothetical protein